MTIDTFSFRYADTAGFMEWFRYNPAQGLWIDRCDGAMQAKRCRMTEEELAELEEVIRCSNRILIMRDGKKAGELGGEFGADTQSEILKIIAGEGASA